MAILDAVTRSEAPGRFVTLPRGMTHYLDTGPRDGPVMLAVHGIASTSVVWKYTTPALVHAGYRVIALDLFGRGWSDRPQGPYNLSLFLEQLDGLLDALGTTAPVHLLGWSMGGLVTAEWANTRPQRVHTLTMFAPAGLDIPIPPFAMLTRTPLVGELLMVSLGKRGILRGLERSFADPQYLAWYKTECAKQWRFPGYRRALLSTLREMPLQGAHATFEALGGRDLPVLVCWGEQDRVCPHHNADLLQTLVPQAEVHTWRNAGHAVHIEEPVNVNAHLLEFLERNATPSSPGGKP